jgi:transcriptional regulator with XRE-family HTH domain
MKERIQEFLIRENKTSAQMAEEIRVQPSGISHILSGRNKPSLDFIIKMLEKYPFLSVEWLLFGNGSMYREPKMGDLFAGVIFDKANDGHENEPSKPEATEVSGTSPVQRMDQSLDVRLDTGQNVTRIVWFYDDNTFEEFFPAKH